MDDTRYRRIRSLVRKLNRQRHEQAKKIDLLCNDMVGAHREFVLQLENLSAGFTFYESLLGHNDLGQILATTFNYVYRHVNECEVAIFLTDGHNFQVHQAESRTAISKKVEKLWGSFTNETVNEISRANAITELGTMFELGLQGNLRLLNEISAAAVPIGRVNGPLGFILICRDIANPLTSGELAKVNAVSLGLCRSIRSGNCLADPSSVDE
ncbi:hypothetical protein STSP2_01325 [Anaerohalosphaera lusitana]|uniref:GAF domain-containing protein n=1 Tax=Anaerohalosphaera lusitana TaxID=1936003 RepID=A0A1U9NKQ5_9BACT|nr:hypothetical protein [Anaerohalosphaera lusitana]AQT68170.1 hypothetical protein STSP2_01325 [Anaerohalosphaera lusitana]